MIILISLILCLTSDHYPKDRIDYQYNEVREDSPMCKEVDDPKEYLITCHGRIHFHHYK